jgi:hypothetical protein
MSKNLHEPSTPRAVAANRYTGKLTQQKPYAFEWVTPVNDADCVTAQAITPWTPCYLNDWEQPTTLEPLSVRLSADGNLQWQGYVNAQNATADIAFIMPGTLGGEPDMIPDVSIAENLSYAVWVTPDDGGSVLTGRAYVDSTTGEVTITYGGGTPWIRRTLTSNEDIANGTNDELIVWDATDNNDPAYFTDTSSTVTTVLVDGVYAITAELVWDGAKVEGSIVTLNSNSTPGFNWNKGWWDEQNAGHTIEHNQTFTYRRRLEANTQLRLYVVQFAAATRTLQGSAQSDDTYMEIHYVGSWNGTAPLD